MAQVITGDGDLFNAVVYGQPNPSIYDFIGRHTEQVSQNMTHAAQAFMASAKDVYRRVTESEAMRRAKAATRRVNSMWQRHGIYGLTSMAQMQNANPDMQRWMMAQPQVREMFHRQECDGFSDTYVDLHPGKVGEEHYDYRRVMNGIVQLTEKTGWEATTYLEDLLPDDVELDLEDQVDILQTWEFLKQAMLDREDDPTSKYNASL